MNPSPELLVLRPDQRPAAPPDRGRLLTAKQVAHELFFDTVSEAWVRRSVPYKIRLGHSTVCWYEADVRAWIDAQRTSESKRLSSD